MLGIRGIAALVVLGGIACSDGGGAPADTSGSAFLAFAPAFQGFHGWESFVDPSDPIATSPHLAGPRTEYLNKRPDPGSTEFPIGTIIVKELGDDPDATKRTVFAMVKRGGGYNPEGASNWEWFELVNDAGGSVSVQWRGVGPPAGAADVYGGDPHVCNDCHGGARANDFVQSKKVQLGAL